MPPSVPGFTSGRDGLSSDCNQTATERIEAAFREEHGRILAALISRLGEMKEVT